jgi:AhpD family alkylhydroperoxidase
MTPRLKTPFKAAPEATKAMMALEGALAASGLDTGLMELVRMRASQINGCAFCIHLHTTTALGHGETPMRLLMLNAWRESPLFTPRERAVLAWTEALTLLPQTGAPDADYEAFASLFSETEQVNLTYLIGSINVWNRLQVGFRAIHPADDAVHVAA